MMSQLSLEGGGIGSDRIIFSSLHESHLRLKKYWCFYEAGESLSGL